MRVACSIGSDLFIKIGDSGQFAGTDCPAQDLDRSQPGKAAAPGEGHPALRGLILEGHDLQQLGDLMNVCHGLLNALRVSSRELEELVQLARENGALGAKLTGGGGGGSIVALCPENRDRVIAAMRDAGYQAMAVDLG